jgi:hypothetical protein
MQIHYIHHQEEHVDQVQETFNKNLVIIFEILNVNFLLTYQSYSLLIYLKDPFYLKY